MASQAYRTERARGIIAHVRAKSDSWQLAGAIVDLVDVVEVNSVLSLGFQHAFHADKVRQCHSQLNMILGPVVIHHLAMLETALDLGGIVNERLSSER